MSDVTMEQDMNNIRSVFSRAVDAIASLPTLTQRVAELEHNYDKVKRELEQVRNTNTWLSEQLGATRAERDNLSRDISVMHRELDETKNQVEELKSRLDERDETIAKLRDELKREQDQNVELLERAVSAENELAQVKAKLAEAMEWIKGIHNVIGQKVAPVQEVPVAQAPPTQVPEHSTIGGGSASMATEPTGEPGVSEGFHDSERREEAPRTGTDPYRW